MRSENILVRPDQSVVVVDFEMSEIDAGKGDLKAEMMVVKHLLASLKDNA